MSNSNTNMGFSLELGALRPGKYRVVMSDDCKDFYAERFGERWRDLTGDKLVLTMAQEIEGLRKQRYKLKQVLSRLVETCTTGNPMKLMENIARICDEARNAIVEDL